MRQRLSERLLRSILRLLLKEYIWLSVSRNWARTSLTANLVNPLAVLSGRLGDCGHVLASMEWHRHGRVAIVIRVARAGDVIAKIRAGTVKRVSIMRFSLVGLTRAGSRVLARRWAQKQEAQKFIGCEYFTRMNSEFDH